ncbi:uncharacterized protein LOC122395282 [Colletes gigas]|uniref:uncharacterized protein LOC122395282 n=1 Tax=Colletes gigas TaxID=935657 RepID=UPI001C9A7368|nr:uncharacterized protein LOC122395282 [Colletes gigas]
MVKFSIYSGVWILTILVIIFSVTGIKNYNNISTIDRQYYEQLEALQDVYVSLNDARIYDSSTFKELKESERLHKQKLTNIPVDFENALVPNSFVNVINYYVDDNYGTEASSILTFNHTSHTIVKKSKASQLDRVNYLWKRRTLCAVSDNEQHNLETLFHDDVSTDAGEKENVKKKTLLNYDEPLFMNNIDDSDALKTHIRVKRSKLISKHDSSFANEQEYLKDLANSFPRNSYESIDENSYDDDVSFDTKREIKSQGLLANDEPIKSIELSNPEAEDENDESKNLDFNPFMIRLPPNTDESARNVIVGKRKSFPSEIAIDPPSDAIKANKVSVTNRQSQDLNVEDPLLAVELVRKKRNDYAKAQNKRNLREKASLHRPDSFLSRIDQKTSADTNVRSEKTSNEKKRSMLDPKKAARDLNVESKGREPSKLAIADLKAALLRFKRTAKNSRREKRFKDRKKKKGNDSSKNARSKNTDRSRSIRERKDSESKRRGKSNVGIANVVSKKTIDNNFRRRYAKSKESNVRADYDDDRSPIRARLTNGDGNKINGDNSEFLLAADRGNGANDVMAESDEITDDQRADTAEDEKSIASTVDRSKLRTKRDENTEANHGFLNGEDELRYYEDIREPERETVGCGGREKSPRSRGKEQGTRTVRSIEEVKELVKKLVTKVNELDSYLNVDEAKRNERGGKRIVTRAIDDLCSNVTTACDGFKEPRKIVQTCVPSAAKTVVERKADVGKRFNAGKESSPRRRSTYERGAGTPSNATETPRGESQKQQSKWGRWTDWSSCSVTCGKGRQIRWRYCLNDCSTAETEMEEKACQLPACPPGKFLGIF